MSKSTINHQRSITDNRSADPATRNSQATFIRRRLFWLLFKVFGVVVLITMVLLLGLIAVALSGPRTDEARFPPSQLAILETYYLGRGSWEGVGTLWAAPPDDNPEEWERFLLLDEGDRVIAGLSDNFPPGELYPAAADRVSFVVMHEGRSVGQMVFTSPFVSPPFIVALGVLPLVVIAGITAVVTLIIGLLLVRRIVTPLADVIAAAQEVTAGDLAARASVSGPDDFRALGDAFNQMVNTLEQNEQQRRNLLADVAHELRTPLTVLRGRLEGILDGIYTPDEEHIAPALVQTHLLQKLVDDLRLLTLAETGQLPFERQPVHLGDLAEQTASLFEAEAMARDVTLAVRTAPEMPPVTADPQRTNQVITNLIHNALRHVPDGGHIDVTVKQVAEGVSLSVSDNGPGVPDADLPHLFDRFWRGEKSRSRSSGGAGLGLAIAKQLVEGQDGRLYAQNQPGSGLRVTFILIAE
ncbi:MAG: ATP-binding protein [Ardenticatenaceae bacterium]|nr:ATP-binding protein [Ardenticatenaceae bacterium]